MDQVLNKPGMKKESRNNDALRAIRGPVHGRPTVESIELLKNGPSSKCTRELQNLKDKFNDICNEGAIEMHKRLEELMK